MSTTISIGATQVRIPTINGEGLPLLDWGAGVSTSIQLLASGLNSISATNNLNQIINGGMEVWNRGLSFSTPVNNAYTADKWRVTYNSTPTFAITANSGSSVDSGFYSLLSNITNASSTSIFNIYQDIETPENYKGKTITFSARILGNQSAAIGIRITDSNGSSNSTYVSNSGNYETLTVSRTLATNIVTLKIEIGYFGASPIISTMYVDSVGMYVSSSAPTFSPFPRSLDEALCVRYYEKQTALAIDFYSTAGTRVFLPVKFAVPKPSAPTIVITNGTLTNLATLAAVNVNTYGFQIQGVVAGLGLAQWSGGAWTAEV